MTIYGISGLGADERVFQYLQIDQQIQPIHWISRKKGESIRDYALRLSQQIHDKDFILIAVSFGGLIAVEISKILTPKLTILISSADTKKGLNVAYRLIGKSGIIHFIPAFLLKPPKAIMHWLFGAGNTKLLDEILDDTDLNFSKWAIIQLTNWSSTDKIPNLIKIHGTKDKLIAHKPDQQTVPIENGAHFMIVDEAKEIGRVLREKIKNVLNHDISTDALNFDEPTKNSS